MVKGMKILLSIYVKMGMQYTLMIIENMDVR